MLTDSGLLASQTEVVDDTARSTRNSPAPVRLKGPSNPGWGRALLYAVGSVFSISSAFTSSGLRLWFLESSTAADPAVIGHENEVPLSVNWPLPVPNWAPIMVPGALISGFSML